MTVDGTELRDQLAEDYRDNARRMGTDVPMDAARALAEADLQMVDALERESRRGPPPPAQNPVLVQEPESDPAPAQTMAMDVGGRFEKRECTDEDKPETLGGISLERRLKLLNRIGELWRRESNGFVYPKYVKLMQEEWANWNFHCKGYARLRTQQERDRMYFRFLENVCDQSNAILPAWWTK